MVGRAVAWVLGMEEEWRGMVEASRAAVAAEEAEEAVEVEAAAVAM